MAIAFYTPDEYGPGEKEGKKIQELPIPVIDFHASFVKGQDQGQNPLDNCTLVQLHAPSSKTLLMGLVFQLLKEVLTAALTTEVRIDLDDRGYGVDHNRLRTRKLNRTRNDNQLETESGFCSSQSDCLTNRNRCIDVTNELNISRGYHSVDEDRQDSSSSTRLNGKHLLSKSTETFPVDELSDSGLALSAREEYARIGRSLRQIADSFQLENNRVNGQSKDVVARNRRPVGIFEYYLLQAINIFKFFQAIKNLMNVFKK